MRRDFPPGEVGATPSLRDVIHCKEQRRYEYLRDVFVRDRRSELESRSVPEVLWAEKLSFREGFLHPKTEIRVVQDGRIPGFRVDDPHIYGKSLDFLKSSSSKPEAVQRTIDSFFGIDHATNGLPSQKYLRNKRREAAYARSGKGRPLSLKDIREERIEMCAEKAAVAQNLITFLGDRSWLVDCYARLTRYDGGIDEGQHLFNIIEAQSNNYTLYDPNHPFEVRDYEGEIIGVQPALFHITGEDFSAIKKGEAIEVMHKEIKKAQNGKEEVALRKYTYGGPGTIRT